jgi:hypothetical protein
VRLNPARLFVSRGFGSFAMATGGAIVAVHPMGDSGLSGFDSKRIETRPVIQRGIPTKVTSLKKEARPLKRMKITYHKLSGMANRRCALPWENTV